MGSASSTSAALPLTLAGLLISLNTNLPRYFIEIHLGEASLGIFSAMAYLIVAGGMLITSLGQAAGITHEQIIDLSTEDYLTSNNFTERERAAVAWAEAVTRNQAQRDSALYERVKAQFSDAEIVELTLICAMFNMINRVNDSLDITIEEQPEIDKIKPSLVLDPEKMRDYLRWLADHWPGDMETLNREAEDAAAA